MRPYLQTQERDTMSDWEPQGETIHDRMMELIRRYIDSALQQTTGMQGMMMRDGATRMYPRIESTIRNMPEEKLQQEIEEIQSQMRKVLGEKEAKQPQLQVAKKRKQNSGKKRVVRTGSANKQKSATNAKARTHG